MLHLQCLDAIAMVDLGLSSALRSLSYASLTTSSFLSPFPSGPTHTLATHRKSFSRAQHPLCSLDVVPKRGRVVVAGGTGFIGRKLVSRLSRDSAEVVVLARNVSAARSLLRDTGARVVAYDASTGPLSRAVASEVAAADAIVNLAGEPVDSGRWTPTRKRVLWDSRVVGTALLARAATKSEFSGAFITASAVGFYGTSENRVFTEEAPAGEDFLGTLARAWENAAWRHTRSAHNVRTVVLRIGVVLGPDGGALQKMKRAFDMFVGGPPGSGKQVRTSLLIRFHSHCIDAQTLPRLTETASILLTFSECGIVASMLIWAVVFVCAQRGRGRADCLCYR